MKGLDGETILLGAGVATIGYAVIEGLSGRKRVVRAAMGELGRSDWLRYLDGVAEVPAKRVAWCGIFALWALHRGGLAKDLRWEYGKGFLYKLKKTKSPKPGDVAYLEHPYQHHAIVEDVVGDKVYTVDGNVSGKVMRRVRPLNSMVYYDSTSKA